MQVSQGTLQARVWVLTIPAVQPVAHKHCSVQSAVSASCAGSRITESWKILSSTSEIVWLTSDLIALKNSDNISIHKFKDGFPPQSGFPPGAGPHQPAP